MIAIVDYGMGNLRSVANAFAAIGCETVVTSRAQDLRRADRIVLPGVGAFADGIANLRNLDLIKPLEEEVLQRKKPFLGICLGLQLLAKRSFENGDHEGFGWLDATVRKLKVEGTGLKLPHIGWNDIEPRSEVSLFSGLDDPLVVYFVHSYHVSPVPGDWVAATCDYGERFVAAIQWRNIFATQFHPEKSQKNGLQILRNFAECTIS